MGKFACAVKLITYLHLGPKLQMYEAILPLLHMCS